MRKKPYNIPISKKRFAHALKFSGWNKTTLAREMEIDLSTIKRNINGTQSMSHENLFKACKIMDVDPNYITGKRNDQFIDIDSIVYPNDLINSTIPPEVLERAKAKYEYAQASNRIDDDHYYIPPFEEYALTEIQRTKNSLLLNFIKETDAMSYQSDDSIHVVPWEFYEHFIDEIELLVEKTITEYTTKRLPNYLECTERKENNHA